MNKKDKSQQTERSNLQAIEVLKALNHFDYPEEPSQVKAWLEDTKPLQSIVKTLCQRDRTGRLTLDCIYVLFDLMATHGEDVSPAFWDILGFVEKDDVKFLVEKFLKESNQKLKNVLSALVTGTCMNGQRVPLLLVWCHAFIQGLEEKENYLVLQSISQRVAFKLLNGIILPHSRKVAFLVFERLLYPMTQPQVFNLVVDDLPDVVAALEGDGIFEKFCGLVRILLERFSQKCSQESYLKVKTAIDKHPDCVYKPSYAVWIQKTKPINKLSSILECPVCYERFVTPITICDNGHCICSNCKNQLRNCPICRGNMSRVRMTIMDQIMEVTEFNCKNADSGCQVKLPYREICTHELDCEYRTVACDMVTNLPPNLICNENVVVAFYHEHIEKHHKAFVREFELNIERKSELSRAKTDEVRLLKNSDGKLYFIERIFVTDEVIFFSYHYIGKSEDADNYVYTWKINGRGFPQKIRYSNFCLPNYMGVIDTEDHERCLILETGKIFFSHQTKIEYSVKIEDVNLYRMRLRKNKFFLSN